MIDQLIDSRILCGGWGPLKNMNMNSDSEVTHRCSRKIAVCKRRAWPSLLAGLGSIR